LERGQRHASTKTKGSVVVNAKDRTEVARAQDCAQVDRSQEHRAQVDRAQEEHRATALTAPTAHW
jgi:hypothetical protein